jgi:hypothetical protein
MTTRRSKNFSSSIYERSDGRWTAAVITWESGVLGLLAALHPAPG